MDIWDVIEVRSGLINAKSLFKGFLIVEQGAPPTMLEFCGQR